MRNIEGNRELVLEVSIDANELPKPTPPEIIIKMQQDCRVIESWASDVYFYDRLKSLEGFAQHVLSQAPDYLKMNFVKDINGTLKEGQYFTVKTPYN